VYLAILRDPKFYAYLLRLDQDLAAEVQAKGCGCGGRLHCADYPRKPRGAPPELSEDYDWRLSFCCASCRRRTTPCSVRYLGRRVYLGAVFVLISAMRMGLSALRLERLHSLVGVSRTTLYRWRTWWASAFLATPYWQLARASFMPPLEPANLPQSLLGRFAGLELRRRLASCLQFLRPLTSRAPSTLIAGR
jgi:hypothetical protein